MGKKLKEVFYNDKLVGYQFYCAGCKWLHCFYVEKIDTNSPVWKFNGDLEKPTFEPSYITGHKSIPKQTCHLFLRDGKLEYLSDSVHELAGQTIDLPDHSDYKKSPVYKK